MWTDHAPNPFCFDCRDAKACPVHYDSTDPAPCGHCFACNSGVACAFHALPAQQEAMACKRAGKDPDLEAAKVRKPSRQARRAEERRAAEQEVFARSETPAESVLRIAQQTADPGSAPFALSPELEATRQQVLGQFSPLFLAKDAGIALSLREGIPTPAQVLAAMELGAIDLPEENWEDSVTYAGTKTSRLKDQYFNLVTVLSKKPFWIMPQLDSRSPYYRTPGGRLCFNEMTRTVHLLIESLGPDGTLAYGHYHRVPLDDDWFAWVRQVLAQRHGLNPARILLEQAVTDVSFQRRFHPIRSFLESLTWDGVARVERVAAEILGISAPKPVELAILKRWLVSLVARVFEPGCKCDTVLVLHGEQGLRKSTFFKILGGEWFCDSPMDLSNKDCFLQLAQSWIYEWSEIGKITRKRDADEIKAFVTSSHDTYRAPYARIAEKHGRSMVFTGTTNEDEFLVDPTGDRRFWVLRVEKPVNLERLTQWHEQLLAEAVHLYGHGEQWHLTPEEELERRALTAPYQRQDVWHDVVAAYLESRGSDEVTFRQILETLGLQTKEHDPRAKERVSEILRGLGWRQTQTGPKTARRRVWRKLA